MNLDDESQISAFLDDEIDPGDRLLVAWSIESSPSSSRQLADLKTTQSLVKGLPRPAIPQDLSLAIVAAIAPTKKALRRSISRRAMRFAAALVGVGAMAASLLLALTLLHQSLHDDSRLESNLSVASTPDRTDPHHTPLIVVEAPTDRSAAANLQGPTDSSTSTSKPRPTELARAKTPGVDGPEPARPGQVDAMLGHRKVLRALIVADVLDRTSSRVRSFIEGDADREPEFGRITLTQGLVVDPDRPGEAEVYSVVMNAPGCGPFLDRLRRAFPSMELENEPEPTLVTQLTEVGQVAVFSGVRPAQLGPAPGELASMVAAKAVATQDHFPTSTIDSLDLSAARTVDRSRTSNEVSARTDEIGDRKLRTSAPAPPVIRGEGRADPLSTTNPDDEPVTVLVWVTRSPKP